MRAGKAAFAMLLCGAAAAAEAEMDAQMRAAAEQERDADVLQFFRYPRVSTKQYEPGCFPVWAKGVNPQCFNEVHPVWPAGEWGWTNVVYEDQGSTTFDLWSGALGCDTTKGTKVGTVNVEVVQGSGSTHTLNLQILPNAGYTAKDVRYHFGTRNTRLPVERGWFLSTPYAFNLVYEGNGPHACVRENGHAWLAMYVEMCACADAGTQPALVKTIETDADWDGGRDSLLPLDIVEGMLGWDVDRMSVTLHHLPPVLLQPGMKAYFPDQRDAIAVGKRFRIKCPANCDSLPCEVIVATYHCAPCSSMTNGRLPALMPMNGWAVGHCSPKFRYTSKKYNMVGFRKVIEAGEELDTPEFELPLSNVAVFVRQGAVDCSNLDDSSQCGQHSSDCFWDKDECKSSWCPPAVPGGRPECTPCAPTTASP